MTMHVPAPATPIRIRFAGLARGIALRLVEFVRAYRHRRDMAMLASFDDRMLRDIGLTRGDLRDAAAEPLWRDPTAVLVTRADERRFHGRGRRARRNGNEPTEAPSLAPDIDDWSSRLFPARSRYY